MVDPPIAPHNSRVETSTGKHGRCVFEFSASSELIVRLSAYPKMQMALEVLPPKVLELSSTEPIHEIELPASSVATRVCAW